MIAWYSRDRSSLSSSIRRWRVIGWSAMRDSWCSAPEGHDATAGGVAPGPLPCKTQALGTCNERRNDECGRKLRAMPCPSPEGATHHSPGREPWLSGAITSSPNGATQPFADCAAPSGLDVVGFVPRAHALGYDVSPLRG